MNDIKWIKLDVGIFEDEKIKIVMSMPEGETMLIIWLKLLCLAGRINNSGVLMVNKTIPYTVEMLSSVFSEKDNIMRLAIDTFQKLGMIDEFNGTLLLPNWEKHQSADKLREIQDKSAARVARHREKQRLEAGNVTVTLQKRICNALPLKEQELRTQNSEQDNKVTAKPPTKRFVPPTVDEVKAYCLERKNRIDPERFVAHYETRGWMLSNKIEMKSWKSAIITWEKNNYEKAEPEVKRGNVVYD